MIMVMLISLIKTGSISSKNKLGMMLSKQNVFAGLSLLIRKQCLMLLSLWLCEENAGLESSTGNLQFVHM